MPRMAEWFGEVERRLTIPKNEGPFPAPSEGSTRTPNDPTSPEPAVEPPVTTTPPVTPPVGMAPLELFLRAITSGNMVFTKEMYDHFDGDQLIQALRQYDPNATWTPSAIGGGEGGEQGQGLRLDFDVTKLPVSKKGTAGLDLRAWNQGGGGRYVPGTESLYDDVYGEVRNSAEFRKDAPSWWEIAAPILISAVAPMAGAALAAGGVGLGAAGATSAVTGGAAGLGAGSIPGALGAGTFAGAATPWWAKPAVQGVQSGLKNTAPYWHPPVLPAGRAPVVPDPTYDPTAYGAFGGTTRSPSSNDSSLVATEFADDPYGFSDTRGR